MTVDVLKNYKDVLFNIVEKFDTKRSSSTKFQNINFVVATRKLVVTFKQIERYQHMVDTCNK